MNKNVTRKNLITRPPCGRISFPILQPPNKPTQSPLKTRPYIFKCTVFLLNNSNLHASLLKLTSEVILNLPDNVKPYGVVGDGVPQGHAPSEDPAEATELFLEASRANFKNAIEFVVAKTGTKIAFLLVDALLSVFVADVAEELNVPWVPVWAASPCALLAYVHAGLICEHWAADHDKKKILP